MQAFDTKRRVQREIEAGIVKFNQKPKDGLAYLVSAAHTTFTFVGICFFRLSSFTFGMCFLFL